MKVFKIIITIALFVLGLYLAIFAPIMAFIDLIDNWDILSTSEKAWDIGLIIGRELLAGIVFLAAWSMMVFVMVKE